METKVYNLEGKETGKINLPDSVFDIPWNDDLMHQVVVSQQSNLRIPIAHTKDRSEVRGGGKKPWRQKGTGQARHGSSRSPLWRGGGITFGPRKEKDYGKKINKKMKVKALFTTLSRKFKDNEIIFVDSIIFAEPKSKKAKDVLINLSKISGFDTLATKRKNAALIALGTKDKNTEKSFQNFGNISVDEARNLDPLAILTYKYLIVSEPENVFRFLESKSGKLNKVNKYKKIEEKTESVKKTMINKQVVKSEVKKPQAKKLES